MMDGDLNDEVLSVAIKAFKIIVFALAISIPFAVWKLVEVVWGL